jgi:hypothetical protein
MTLLLSLNAWSNRHFLDCRYIDNSKTSFAIFISSPKGPLSLSVPDEAYIRFYDRKISFHHVVYDLDNGTTESIKVTKLHDGEHYILKNLHLTFQQQQLPSYDRFTVQVKIQSTQDPQIFQIQSDIQNFTYPQKTMAECEYSWMASRPGLSGGN